jgi:hypothetical protein
MGFSKGAKRGILFKSSIIFVFIWFFLVFLLFGTEFFVRIFFHDVLSTADGTSYFSLKNQRLFEKERNGFGFRGKEFKETPDDRYRIVVLGDSFTYGQGVYPAKYRFTEQIESTLNKQQKGKGIEIVNVGICGFNLPNHYKFLHFIDAIQPDYVLYQWYINDMSIRPDVGEYKASHLVKNREVHTWLWKHSALYYLMQRGYGSLQRSKGEKKTYQQYMFDNHKNPSGKAAMDARELLGKYIDHYKNTNTDFGMVLFPSFAAPMNNYILDFLHEQVLDVCKEKNVECLDLREAYRNVEDNTKLWANVFDPHPGVLAHKIAADAIYSFFGTHWKDAAQKENVRMIPQSLKNDKAQPEMK